MPDLPQTTQSSWLETATAGIRPVPSPNLGWLRGVRETLGLSRRTVAEQLEISQAAVRDFERAEMKDAITLRTFRRTAQALGCELVIALVPASNRSFAELAALHEIPGRRHPRPRHRNSFPAAGDESGDLEMHLK